MPDYLYINSTGAIIPQTSDVLDEVADEYRQAFGNGLALYDTEGRLLAETPQGLLITSDTATRRAVIQNNADIANQINPNFSGGVFLDAICALTETERESNSRSVVTATLSGTPGTVILSGAIATTNAGDEFELINDATISETGSVDAVFQSVEFGEIAAPAGTLVNISASTDVIGWDSITNSTPATLGSLQESDMSLAKRRRRELANVGHTLSYNVISGLYTVDGVRSVAFRENKSNVTDTIDGITLGPHSMWACVQGGDDSEIAAMIMNKKSGGCDTTGNTSVDYTDPESGQLYTGSQAVRFNRPDEVSIAARFTIRSGSSITDPVQSIIDAVIDYSNGDQDGEDGFIIGNDVSPWELAGAVNRQSPSIFITNVEIATITGGTVGTYQSTPISISLEQVATIDQTNISVVVM